MSWSRISTCLLLLSFVGLPVDGNGPTGWRNRDSKQLETLNLKGFSFPGTKWCGPGDTATDYNDLGEDREVDMCCREHDQCDYIGKGESKYGLTNTGSFTVLHCNCDQKFRECLKKIDSRVSYQIGFIYFDLQTMCYQEEHPIKGCKLTESSESLGLAKRCVKYDLDVTQPPKYQWFDLPAYISKYF